MGILHAFFKLQLLVLHTYFKTEDLLRNITYLLQKFKMCCGKYHMSFQIKKIAGLIACMLQIKEFVGAYCIRSTCFRNKEFLRMFILFFKNLLLHIAMRSRLRIRLCWGLLHQCFEIKEFAGAYCILLCIRASDERFAVVLYNAYMSNNKEFVVAYSICALTLNLAAI